jgi:hypothetical protein
MNFRGISQSRCDFCPSTLLILGQKKQSPPIFITRYLPAKTQTSFPNFILAGFYPLFSWFVQL